MSQGYTVDTEALHTAARTLSGISAGLAETIQPPTPDAGSVSEAIGVAFEHLTRAVTYLSEAFSGTADDLDTTARTYDESDASSVVDFRSLHERP